MLGAPSVAGCEGCELQDFLTLRIWDGVADCANSQDFPTSRIVDGVATCVNPQNFPSLRSWDGVADCVNPQDFFRTLVVVVHHVGV